ncbi:hypothetical protein G3A_05610 [Bacillus sp. 17376]|nr:hypothetical protein G3A_05610 [Bacillus sp. 17376]
MSWNTLSIPKGSLPAIQRKNDGDVKKRRDPIVK